MTHQSIDTSKQRAIKRGKSSVNSQRMIAMLDERQKQEHAISEAQHAKREVEDEIITTLLRDNDQRCVTVNWRKLYKLSGWGQS